MTVSKSLTYSIKICLAVITLGIGTMANSMSAFAQEEIITEPKPLEVYNGTVQDLGGTESKTIEEWLGGVGGEYVSTDETINDEATRYKFDQNSYEAKTEALNLTLEGHDASLGDVQRPTRRFPLINF